MLATNSVAQRQTNVGYKFFTVISLGLGQLVGSFSYHTISPRPSETAGHLLSFPPPDEPLNDSVTAALHCTAESKINIFCVISFLSNSHEPKHLHLFVLYVSE